MAIMQIETFETMLREYSELTALQVVLLVALLFALWMLVQTWINRARVKAAAVVAEKQAESDLSESKQRDQTTASLLAMLTRFLDHLEDAERRSVEARNDAHEALNKMAEAVAGIGKLIEGDRAAASEQNSKVISGIAHIVSIAEAGSPPVKRIETTVAQLMTDVEALGVAMRAANEETGTKLDTIITHLMRAKQDLELAQEAIEHKIDEVCKEQEKRRTDSKPIVIIPLPAEDNQDKQEATA